MKADTIVVRHEVGHLMALIATGLYDEFTRLRVGALVNATGDAVNGETDFSRRALGEYVHALCSLSQRVATGASSTGDLSKYIDDNVCSICLPYLCTYLGGGAIDALHSCADENRNRLDAREIKTHVLPGMFLAGLSHDDAEHLKKLVCVFLEKVFVRESNTIHSLVESLSATPDVGKAEMDGLVAREVADIQARALADYQELLQTVRSWYRVEVKKLNPWFEA